MGIYIYTKTKEIRKTVTEIPQHMWAKKGLLPYELKIVEIREDQISPTIERFQEFEDKMVETRIKYIKVKTLDELKEEKINMLKSKTLFYVLSVYPEYKQNNALLSLMRNGVACRYTIEEANNILDWCRSHQLQVDVIEKNILNAVNQEQIDLEPDTVEFEVV